MNPLKSKKTLLKTAGAVVLAAVALPLLVSAASKQISHTHASPAMTQAQLASLKQSFLSHESHASGSMSTVSGNIISITAQGIFVSEVGFVAHPTEKTKTHTRSLSPRVATTTILVPITSATKINYAEIATSTNHISPSLKVGERVLAIEQSTKGATTTEMVMVLPAEPAKKIQHPLPLPKNTPTKGENSH